MSEIPNLAGIATENLVESIGSGSFSARYINWAKTLNLLHEHAPGWMPHLVHLENGDIVHRVADSAYVLIYFVHVDDTALPPVLQAIMDNRHKAIPFDQITAVDVSNAVVRGYCKAAAVCFGLAFELWSGDAMESGYTESRVTLNAKPDEEPAEGWRGVAIHFGKNKGKTLGYLAEEQKDSLKWYQRSWDPETDKDGIMLGHPVSDEDKRLRVALDASMNEEHEVAQSISDDMPF